MTSGRGDLLHASDVPQLFPHLLYLVTCHLSLDVGDEEGRDGKFLLLSGEPQLVAVIPSQRVNVGEEAGLLHVLPH